jgi:hypothetical protein
VEAAASSKLPTSARIGVSWQEWAQAV